MNNLKLSIVIPLYNEERRVESGLSKVFFYLKNRAIFFEIILVNDGSTDKTLKIVKEFQKSHSKIKIISYKKNKGKGFAIKNGILASKGAWVMFCDIDLSVPITEFSKFQRYLIEPPKVIIASRRVRGAKIISHQPFIRETLGHMFTKLSNLVLATKCTDFTCGFKIFDCHSAKKLFTKQCLNRWGFDSEIIFLASKYHVPLLEIPVSWKNSVETKVKLPKDLINSFFELIQIQVNNQKGLYDFKK